MSWVKEALFICTYPLQVSLSRKIALLFLTLLCSSVAHAQEDGHNWGFIPTFSGNLNYPMGLQFLGGIGFGKYETGVIQFMHINGSAAINTKTLYAGAVLGYDVSASGMAGYGMEFFLHRNFNFYEQNRWSFGYHILYRMLVKIKMGQYFEAFPDRNRMVLSFGIGLGI